MITDYLNLFLYKHLFFYRYLVDFAWPIGQMLFIVLWCFLIKKKKISGRVAAAVGFFILFAAMICNIFGLDIQAGLFAQYVLILFFISFSQEFYHFLKYENKKKK